ncbi:MAG: PQQ-binding-like beta-propeller repeat protein [Verrucomicrobiae bacterium]|nr:PQQ-binding-like beta-propeller repeat protein [Verrucomicrobiae bacterium]
MSCLRFVPALALWCIASSFTCVGADWPHFLGPKYDLHCEETGLQLQFPEGGPRKLWEVDRGRGHAGPVVVGERVIFIHQVDDKEEVCCLDAETGKRLWDHSYPVKVSQSYGIVDAPRSSPVADPESGLVFTFGNDGDLICFRMDSGDIVWQRSIPETFGEGPFFFGYGSSPLVYGEKLILNAGSEDACVVALEKSTGKVLWQSDHAWHGSYASPIVAPLNGKDRVLVFTGGMVRPPTGGLLCVDPDNGNIESEFPWRSDNFASVNAASPVYCDENRIFISEDYGLGGVMLQFDGNNQPSVLWTSPDLGCQFQTPVYHQGTLYGVGGGGGLMMACDVRTGRPLWNEMFYQTTIPWQGREIPISLGRAHLVYVDGGFLCLSENGALIRLQLNPGGFEILAKARPFYAPESWAPPVISGGRLYVMQNEMGSKLYCFDLRNPSSASSGPPPAEASSVRVE